MSYNTQAEINLLRNGQATKAQMIVPPGVVGHDPAYRSSIAYEPELASRLLDYFGYKKGTDGYRTMPDGSPLVLKIRTEANASSRVISEIWKRGLDKIGVKAEFEVGNFADNVKDATGCRLMMWGGAWHADYPDGENFMQLLYGANAGQGNHGCYQSKAFDKLYRQAVKLPPGKARDRLYVQMNRQMEADTAWSVHVSRTRNWLVRPLGDGIQEASDFIVGLAVSGYQQINVIRILRKEDEISCYWIVRIIRKRQNDFAGKDAAFICWNGLDGERRQEQSS